MTKTRREILEASLNKKEAEFHKSLSIHMDDVKGAQGEPMAGHRAGEKVLSRWDKQNRALLRKQESIDKTKNALAREDERDAAKAFAKSTLSDMPAIIQTMVEDGRLNQWNKHPTIFFVEGVSKARIQIKKGKAYHRFATKVASNDEFQIFRTVYNEINKEVNK